MKPGFLFLILVASNSFAATLHLPSTMDAGSVQAKLKGVLFEKLEKDGPITAEYSASLTGDYSEVVLEDEHSRIVCGEHSGGMLPVQMFYCDITTQSSAEEVSSVSLTQTMDSASVQAIVKELLFQKLDSEGPVTSPYEASLTGSYSEVVLEDESSKVVCREHSAGMLAVQTFGCDFETK